MENNAKLIYFDELTLGQQWAIEEYHKVEEFTYHRLEFFYHEPGEYYPKFQHDYNKALKELAFTEKDIIIITLTRND